MVKRIKAIGGKCIKLDVRSEAGLPDRLCIIPSGKYFFVELKSYGETPRPIQEYQIHQLKRRGCDVFVIDNRQDLELLLDGFS